MNKISIIIPCHNYARYLDECIKSCLNQTYKNIEIIIVDDSSKDNPKMICDKYPVNYYRVDFNFANKTRNFGIQHSTGNYILFLDADNYLEKDCLSKMLKCLLANSNSQYCYCDRFIIDDNSIKTGVEQFPEFDAKIFLKRNFVDLCSLIKRDAGETINWFSEDKKIFAFEDWHFFYNLAKKKLYGIHLAENLIYYRMHKKSKSRYLELHPFKCARLRKYILS